MNKIFLSRVFIVILVAFLYFITGKLSFWLSFSNKIVVMSIFFPEGIALAFTIIAGYFIFWGVLIGQFFLAYLSGLDILPALFIGIVNSIEVIIAYFLLVKTGLIKKFNTIKELYILFAVIFLVLQPFSAFFGNLTLLTFGVINKAQFPQSLASWYMGNTVSQALIVPVLLCFYFNKKRIHLNKFLISVVSGILIGYLLFFLSGITYFSLLLGITLTISLLIATFLDVFYVGVFLVILYMTVLLSFKSGNTIFFKSNIIENLININFYFFAHIFIVYTYSFLLKEKEKYLKQLQELNLSLEEKIKKAVKENQKQQEILFKQARFAQIGELMSIIAHQWKQPLNSIALIIQSTYLKHQLGKLQEEDINQCFNATQEKIKNMSQMLHNFSELFKPKSEKRKFPVSEVIQKTVNLIKPALENNNIKLNVSIKGEIYLESYPEELGQVLLNIITNSKDVLEKKEQEEKYINISVAKKNHKVYITVEDNGGGIPEDIKEKVFEPYFSTKGNVGTGLGLYIAKMIVEQHMNGKMYVNNTDRGAKFIIELSLYKN